jgi:hypothetical protein
LLHPQLTHQPLSCSEMIDPSVSERGNVTECDYSSVTPLRAVSINISSNIWLNSTIFNEVLIYCSYSRGCLHGAYGGELLLRARSSEGINLCQHETGFGLKIWKIWKPRIKTSGEEKYFFSNLFITFYWLFFHCLQRQNKVFPACSWFFFFICIINFLLFFFFSFWFVFYKSFFCSFPFINLKNLLKLLR